MFIPFHTSNRKRFKYLYLEDIMYVPGLDCILMSCYVLDRKGFSCESADGFSPYRRMELRYARLVSETDFTPSPSMQTGKL